MKCLCDFFLNSSIGDISFSIIIHKKKWLNNPKEFYRKLEITNVLCKCTIKNICKFILETAETEASTKLICKIFKQFSYLIVDIHVWS